MNFLEYWNIGVLEIVISPLFYHSITPSFLQKITPFDAGPGMCDLYPLFLLDEMEDFF